MVTWEDSKEFGNCEQLKQQRCFESPDEIELRPLEREI